MKTIEQKAKKVPAIRFAGFDDEWVEKKLGDVVGVYDGVHQTPDYQNEGVMFLSVENISSLKSEKFISQEAFEKNYKVYPQKGDVLMTRIGDVGTPNVVETDEKLAYYVSLALLKPFDVDSYFLNSIIQSISFQQGLKERTLLTAIPMKINKDEIGKVGLTLPNKECEQKKLGELFNHIDSLISLEQKKYDKLTQVKKSMLEKMFPKEGATVPEIRFAGFSGDWKERKLSQLVSYFSSNLTAKDVQENGIYDLYDANGVIGKINCSPRKKEYISVIKDGAGVGRIRKLPKNTLVIGTMGILESIDSDLNFVFAMLERFELGKQFTGSTIPHIYFKDYGEHLYVVPDYCEQQKIGSYFSHLDSLISLQQRKLEKLKNIKKSLLEKMFV